MDDRLSYILKILSTIPEKPGCYQYFDRKGTIIYVGKAKNLRKRVSSYFQKEHENNKTRVLVKHIYDLKYIVVDSEEDALLLENNLIKQYRPRYNVLLKDDKTYPSIVIKNEYFPRIFQTRNIPPFLCDCIRKHAYKRNNILGLSCHRDHVVRAETRAKIMASTQPPRPGAAAPTANRPGRGYASAGHAAR